MDSMADIQYLAKKFGGVRSHRIQENLSTHSRHA